MNSTQVHAHPIILRPRQELTVLARPKQHEVCGPAHCNCAHAARSQAHRGGRNARDGGGPAADWPVQLAQAYALHALLLCKHTTSDMPVRQACPGDRILEWHLMDQEQQAGNTAPLPQGPPRRR